MMNATDKKDLNLQIWWWMQPMTMTIFTASDVLDSVIFLMNWSRKRVQLSHRVTGIATLNLQFCGETPRNLSTVWHDAWSCYRVFLFLFLDENRITAYVKTVRLSTHSRRNFVSTRWRSTPVMWHALNVTFLNVWLETGGKTPWAPTKCQPLNNEYFSIDIYKTKSRLRW